MIKSTANKAIKTIFQLLPKPLQEYLRHGYVYKRYIYNYYRRSVTVEGSTLTSADELKCIFIHIPKCAGTSISQALFGNFGGGHILAADYQWLYAPEEYTEFFKFTFVRNPWDRLVSAFYFLKSGGITDEDKRFSAKNLARYDTFEKFVTEWVTPQNIMRYYHFQPQVHFLCVDNRPPRLDFMGYYENIAEDFSFVCNRLGVKADLVFWNKARIGRGGYRTLYTDRMKQIVAEVYAQDIALLGYVFDNSNLNQLLAARNSGLRRKTGVQ